MQNGRKIGLAVVEIIYIFTTIIIIIINFLLLAVTSERNSHFSKYLVTARLLSQEGIKTIIDLKKQDKTSIIIGSRSYTWPQLFDKIVTLPECANPSDLTISCADFTFKECNTANSNSKYSCIEIHTNPYTDVSWRIPEAENKIFSRKIRITNAENNAKNITVFVWWIDSDGLHTSPITYKLMKGQK